LAPADNPSSSAMIQFKIPLRQRQEQMLRELRYAV
jgi:hypothetical protein